MKLIRIVRIDYRTILAGRGRDETEAMIRSEIKRQIGTDAYRWVVSWSDAVNRATVAIVEFEKMFRKGRRIKPYPQVHR